MDDEKLLAFHEKLYYHEFDNREKLTARLQLCLGMLTVLVGLLIYMLSHFDATKASPPGFWAVTLLVTFLFGTAGLIAASNEFVRALWNNNAHYECLPFSAQLENYRSTLITTYAECEEWAGMPKVEYNKFLLAAMAKCTSTNAALNAKRYDHLHDSISYIVYSIPFVGIAGLAFVIGGFLKQGA